MEGGARVLIVTAPAEAERLGGLLADLGHSVCAAADSMAEGLAAAAAARPDLVLLDTGLAPADGGELRSAADAGDRFPVPVVLLAGPEAGMPAGPPEFVEAVYGVVEKPANRWRLQLGLEAALAALRRERALEEEHRDATARTGARAAILEKVFRSMSGAVVATDPNQERFLCANPAAMLFAHDPQTIQTPADWYERYEARSPDGRTLYGREDLPLTRAIRGEIVDGFEMLVRDRVTDQTMRIEATGRPLVAGDGTLLGGVIMWRDVSAIRETEAKLRRAMGRLDEQVRFRETVLHTIADGVIAADADGTYLFSNESAHRIVGYNLPDADSRERVARYGLLRPDRKTPFATEDLPLMRALRGESSDDVEMFLRNPRIPEGKFVHISGRPLRSEDGTPEGGVIVFRDVTRLKQAETDLREALARVQDQAEFQKAVLDAITDGVLVTDLDGRYVFANAVVRPMIPPGMGEATLKEVGTEERVSRYGLFLPDGRTPFPPEDMPLARAIHGESTDEVEMMVRNPKVPDGLYLQVSARPLCDRNGAVTGSVGVLRDVTRLKRTEAELRETAEELRRQSHTLETIFHSISDGVVVSDENGQFTMFNPSAERIVGIGAVDTDPENWSKAYGIFFPDRETPMPPEELPLSLAIRGESCDEMDLFIRNPMIPDGVFLSVNGRPLRDETGLVRGGVAVFRDVTERMQAEQALTRAFAEGRVEILDTVLHNIGNAMNSVATGVSAIREEYSTNEPLRRLAAVVEAVESHREDLARYLDSDPQGRKVLPFLVALAEDLANQAAWLERTVGRVNKRVGHIVDIIRSQRSLAGGPQTRKDIPPTKAITDALRVLQESLDQRGYRVRTDCSGAPDEIRVQESRLHQALVNLVKNAMEALDERKVTDGFREAPGIAITARTEERHLVFEVKDNGIGFEPGRARRLFMAGYTTKDAGSGLGLHSAANFAVASGGTAEAISEGRGKGATIRLRLQLSRVAVPSRAAGEKVGTSGG